MPPPTTKCLASGPTQKAFTTGGLAYRCPPLAPSSLPPSLPTPPTTRHGTHGLAADVRHYGKLIRESAQQKIGRLYPKVRLPKEHGDVDANVIAWIWARTVRSPNPAARGKHVPLVSSFMISKKAGNEVWVEPVKHETNADG